MYYVKDNGLGKQIKYQITILNWNLLEITHFWQIYQQETFPGPSRFTVKLTSNLSFHFLMSTSYEEVLLNLVQIYLKDKRRRGYVPIVIKILFLYHSINIHFTATWTFWTVAWSSWNTHQNEYSCPYKSTVSCFIFIEC